jgi:hypothetical protein
VSEVPWFADPIAKLQELPERLRGRIRAESPVATACWLWLGAAHYMGRAGEGYGRVWWRGRNALAHRVVYELLVGGIPKGLVLDHLKTRCAHRHCVRPDHMEPVTVEVNTMRGVANGMFVRREEQDEVPF